MQRALILGSVCLLFTACDPFGHDRDGLPVPPPPPVTDGGTACSGTGGGGLFGGGGGGGGSGTCNSTVTAGKRCQSDSECSGKETCRGIGFEDKYCVAHCAADADCGSDALCIDNACFTRCTGDSQCHNDFRCSDRWGETSGTTYCLPDMRGLACKRTFDCNDPKMRCVGTAGLNTDQFGICTADCSQDASICGDTATCVKNVCVLACKTNDDCPAHEHCGGNICITDQSTTPRPLGAACTAGGQCATGGCATNFPDGYCTAQCSGAADCGTGICIVLTDTQSICMEKCYFPGEQDSCRDYYTCSQVKDQNYGVCVPAK